METEEEVERPYPCLYRITGMGKAGRNKQ